MYLAHRAPDRTGVRAFPNVFVVALSVAHTTTTEQLTLLPFPRRSCSTRQHHRHTSQSICVHVLVSLYCVASNVPYFRVRY